MAVSLFQTAGPWGARSSGGREPCLQRKRAGRRRARPARRGRPASAQAPPPPALPAAHAQASAAGARAQVAPLRPRREPRPVLTGPAGLGACRL